LQDVDLNRPGDFTALTHTWGPEHPTVDILLNKRPFKVRKNLWGFLAQGRASGHAQSLWISAVSINQDDIGERNHQVALMSKIYRKASTVLVWLGTATEHSGPAMTHLRDLNHDPVIFNRRFRSDDAGMKTALCEFIYHPYWRRVWVQQEFALAKQLLLL